jgi:hypothetical protein
MNETDGYLLVQVDLEYRQIMWHHIICNQYFVTNNLLLTDMITDCLSHTCSKSKGFKSKGSS